MIQGVFPARDADAPFVARFQSGEAPFRPRRDEIISIENREIEKLLCNFDAHRVQPDVFRPSAAKAVAIKPGHRIAAATFKFTSQNISWHDASLTSEPKFARCWVLKTASRSEAYSSKMKNPAITYWLIPAEPAHSSFQDLINDLARQYDAPVFEPHMTIHVGLHGLDVAERVAEKASACCGRIKVKILEVSHSNDFTKTLFVRFALHTKLSWLNEIIRCAAKDSSDYRLKPHVSLLYKKMPVMARRKLADSIKLPFSHVVFDSIKVVRCISPTRTRADVEAWRVVAAKPLAG